MTWISRIVGPGSVLMTALRKSAGLSSAARTVMSDAAKEDTFSFWMYLGRVMVGRSWSMRSSKEDVGELSFTAHSLPEDIVRWYKHVGQ
jgi:hypothetical protein